MKLYKAQIELHSPIATPLKGDTIWGHIVWGIATHEGDIDVAAFLAGCHSSNPPFVISSAFPQGMLPRPILSERVVTKILTKTEYAQIKAKKKSRFIPSFLNDSIEIKGNAQPYFIKESEMHNTIDRLSLTVQDQGLFSSESMWPNPNAFMSGRIVFDLYIASDYEEDRIMQLLIWAFENGYGADASSGKGVVTVLPGLQKIQIPAKHSNRYMALGPFVLGKEKIPEDLLSNIFVRRGKIGGGFGNSFNPFKKTVILFDEGATFMCNEGTLFVGNLITDVHSDSRICQSGFCPIIPLPEGATHEETV
ncbi:CRISPR-associated protein Csm4 [Sphaerochaeta sp. S2]|uniref:type III-A CRISPR-associated RAMP protein Csm4 n=1 Tax=Sphaerochaeta sp. S2 TaxID=2798868 RepID=UPI0018E99FC2|nr:CRISPR-associated protein Csm4 [Sphaerochaeta sp. S2]MBJ2356730.1 CRISPR-associated protein Csm4 [Sphaerochaeta sp. S2]